MSFTSRALTVGLALAAITAVGCARGTQSSASVTATIDASPTPVASDAPSDLPTALVVSEHAPARGPYNTLVANFGKPGAIALDPAAAAALKKIAASVSPAKRARLRYALAPDSAGNVHLVVYDGMGLPADGKPAGKKFEYIVFKPINAADGSSYDPAQNSIDEPVPTPKERDSSVTFHD